MPQRKQKRDESPRSREFKYKSRKALCHDEKRNNGRSTFEERDEETIISKGGHQMSESLFFWCRRILLLVACPLRGLGRRTNSRYEFQILSPTLMDDNGRCQQGPFSVSKWTISKHFGRLYSVICSIFLCIVVFLT